MRKTYSVLLIAAVLLSFGWMGASSAVHQDCCHPSVAKSGRSAALATTPARPMSSLNAEDVRKEFNASSQKARVVALLSPTCPDCQSGHGVVGRMLKKFPSPKLKAILVWEPMRDGDNATSATQQAETVQDIRISQGWDGGHNLGRSLDKLSTCIRSRGTYISSTSQESNGKVLNRRVPRSGCTNSKALIPNCSCAKTPLV